MQIEIEDYSLTPEGLEAYYLLDGEQMISQIPMGQAGRLLSELSLIEKYKDGKVTWSTVIDGVDHTGEHVQDESTHRAHWEDFITLFDLRESDVKDLLILREKQRYSDLKKVA